MPDCQAFQPVLGRKFHVESEFEVRNSRLKRPEGKIKENIPQKKYVLTHFLLPDHRVTKTCVNPRKTYKKPVRTSMKPARACIKPTKHVYKLLYNSCEA